MERSQKIENIALWIKNLESDAVAYKAEKDAFAEREASARKKAESLKKWLAWALGGQKFNSTRCAVSFRKSEKVEILDSAVIPPSFCNTKVETVPDKVAIKEALKSGEEVSGCRLIQSLNTQIK